MNNYYELTDIETKISVRIELEGLGTPRVRAGINDNLLSYPLFKPSIIYWQHDSLQPFEINVELSDKNYVCGYETAVIIKTLQIDGVDIIPRFLHLAHYTNDHNNDDPTNYLGFNGRWTLNIDRPFYQWLHQATGQGWLLS